MDEKQVYENQETAIKLLEENVELKKRIKEAIKYFREQIRIIQIDNTSNFELDVYMKEKEIDEYLKILEGDKNE